MLIFKTLKNILVRLPLHVSVHIYDHLQGTREQYFVQLLNWIPLMYVRCVFVQYAAVSHYRRFVCVSGAAVRVRHGHRPDLTRTGAPDIQVITYGHILYTHTANGHQRNSI
jgi:hypothetical protein